MPPIFVSYSRKDAAFVRRLVKDLKSAKISVWLDELDIPAGHPWDFEIEKALDEATQMLVVLSSRSVQSPNVLNEISFAVETNKHILPIMIDECRLPLIIRRLHYTDFRSDYGGGFRILMRNLGLDVDSESDLPFLDDPPTDYAVRLPREDATGMIRLPAQQTSALTEIVAMLVPQGENQEWLSAAPISEVPFIIGRALTCSLRIPHNLVSREHARILFERSTFLIEDMSSRNGTFVNGQRITGLHTLKADDLLNFGMVAQYRFDVGSEETGFVTPVELPEIIPPQEQIEDAGLLTLGETAKSRRVILDMQGQKLLVKQQSFDPPLEVEEFRLLNYLHRSAGLVTRIGMYRAVMQDPDAKETDPALLDGLIDALRDRLKALDPEHEYIIKHNDQVFRFDNGFL